MRLVSASALGWARPRRLIDFLRGLCLRFDRRFRLFGSLFSQLLLLPLLQLLLSARSKE